MTHVALFGGSFNPPHLGHMFAALYVLETHDVDELWFLPAFQHPFEKTLAPFVDRFAMCSLVAAALGARARVSDIEAELGGASLTLRTVKRLIHDFPEARFSLIIGGDLIAEVDGWHGSAELKTLIEFIVVNRSGHEIAAVPDGTRGSAPMSVAMPAVSSTQIRDALKRTHGASGWVSRSVLDYIASRGLYGLRQPDPK